MKLLGKYESSRLAEIHALALENQGIMVHVSSRHSHSLGAWVTGAFSVGLWVVFDHQIDDAKAFISDHNYEVISGFSAEEILRLQDHAYNYTYLAFNRFLIFACLGLFAVISIIAARIYSLW
jgi:hypothetical protein